MGEAALASSVTQQPPCFSEECPHGRKLPQDIHILTRVSEAPPAGRQAQSRPLIGGSELDGGGPVLIGVHRIT